LVSTTGASILNKIKYLDSQLATQAEVIQVAKEALEDIAQMIIKHKTPEQIAREVLARIAEMDKRDLEFILEEEKGEL
jgi:predicted subunit of tRNA(5-methylaminomethyl-2-thiouridylate) methyltransferase